MITPLGWLERVPTYKEQQENLTGKDLSTYGFLGYPLLQAADILIYQADFVPVGQDQVAHVELTREVARRFNQFYPKQASASSEESVVLPEPQVLLTPSPKLPGTDGRKMSKSYGNTILLTDPEPVVRKKLKTMVTDPARVRRTDPGDPDKLPGRRSAQSLFQRRRHWQKSTKAAARRASAASSARAGSPTRWCRCLTPIQERRSKYESNAAWSRIFSTTGERRATRRAEQTMREVRAAMRVAASKR